ncbi:hypothetical protein [Mycobacterium sp.]|uniref:hypothetical protein n=1 Tax=Mycobacterium sp. TaxID=1785 RepID=UPI0025E85608|nr:hypothetical protein [Mycobacterium sp.]
MHTPNLTEAEARAYDAWFDKPWGAHAWAVELAAVEAALPDACHCRMPSRTPR